MLAHINGKKFITDKSWVFLSLDKHNKIQNVSLSHKAVSDC